MGHVEDEVFAKLERALLSVNFKLFGVPELRELTDGSYQPDSGRKKKLPKRLCVVFLASALAAFFSGVGL